MKMDTVEIFVCSQPFLEDLGVGYRSALHFCYPEAVSKQLKA